MQRAGNNHRKQARDNRREATERRPAPHLVKQLRHEGRLTMVELLDTDRKAAGV